MAAQLLHALQPSAVRLAQRPKPPAPATQRCATNFARFTTTPPQRLPRRA